MKNPTTARGRRLQRLARPQAVPLPPLGLTGEALDGIRHHASLLLAPDDHWAETHQADAQERQAETQA